ncbi:MAG: DNRLRE domain-containing protein [Gemmatimonadota bacterium]
MRLTYPILISLVWAHMAEPAMAAPPPLVLEGTAMSGVARSAPLSLGLLACLLGCGDQDPVRVESPRLLQASDTIVTQLTPIADTHIRSTIPDTNRGTQDRLWVRGKNGRDRSLVQFDSAAIRAEVGAGTLTSAHLELTVDTAFGWGGSGRWVGAYRMLRSWTELGATFNCADDPDPGNGTFDCAPADQWDMAAAPGTEFAGEPTDTLLFVNDQTGSVQFDVTADVQAFLNGSAPHFGWILARTDEDSGGKVEFDSKEGVNAPVLRVEVETAGVDTLAPAVPDSTPWDLPDTLYSSPPGDTITLMYRTVVDVGFDKDTPGATINAFLVAFQAQVIGGAPYLNEYTIRIPDPGPTWTAVRAVFQQMLESPHVRWFSPRYKRVRPDPAQQNLRLPDDAPLLQRNDWLAEDEYSWAFRAVSAPEAWGCVTGMYGEIVPRIAVIDFEFDSLSTVGLDIQASVDRVSGPAGPTAVENHGLWVASLATAPGDNGIGIAGMVWRSRLSLNSLGVVEASDRFVREVVPELKEFMPDIVLASIDPTRFPEDSTEAARVAEAMRSLFTKVPGMLWVNSADNDGNDAPRPNGLFVSVLADSVWTEVGSRILIVSGSAPGDSLWNEGPFDHSGYYEGRTEIAAPAYRVPVAHRTGVWHVPGTQIPESAVSFAAPLVAGAAAQLKAMDPSISPAEIKQKILAGPEVPRFRNGSPLPIPKPLLAGTSIRELDAYGSLQLLAKEKPGQVPICGYPVALGGGGASPELQFLTDPNGAVGHTISLAGRDVGVTERVSVAQGGRLISFSEVPPGGLKPRAVVMDYTGAVVSTLDSIAERRFLETDTLDVTWRGVTVVDSRGNESFELQGMDLYVTRGADGSVDHVDFFATTLATDVYSWYYEVDPTGTWGLIGWTFQPGCSVNYYAVPMSGAARTLIHQEPECDVFPSGAAWRQRGGLRSDLRSIRREFSQYPSAALRPDHGAGHRAGRAERCGRPPHGGRLPRR